MAVRRVIDAAKIATRYKTPHLGVFAAHVGREGGRAQAARATWLRRSMCATLHAVPPRQPGLDRPGTLSQPFNFARDAAGRCGRRSLSSGGAVDGTDGTAKALAVDAATFEAEAEATLEMLEAALEEALEAALEAGSVGDGDGDGDDLDVSCSMGVLTAQLGARGTYVINKQGPNRQLWWSSPLSGPKRFYWSAEAGAWLNSRDDSPMWELLEREVQQLLGVALRQQ